MILKISCPSCHSKLNITVENDIVVSVKVDGVSHTSENQIAETLKKHNIEFG